MHPNRCLLPLIVMFTLSLAAGCAATPEDRWYQQREALNTANAVYLANVPHMSDEQIVHYGELLQAARSSLEQAKAHLPEGGSSFDAALDVVEAILLQLAASPTHSPVTEIESDERH